MLTDIPVLKDNGIFTTEGTEHKEESKGKTSPGTLCPRGEKKVIYSETAMKTVTKAKKKKSWKEKLADSKDLPKTAKIEGKLSTRWGEGTFVIPAPLEVDAVMKIVRPGKLTTIDAIRKVLAKKHDVTIACPITTGIFAWIAAHAADEDEAAGRKRITPYWRTLKAGGEMNPKYPGGIKNLRARLTAEGHRVVKKGARYFVADLERVLVKPRDTSN